MAHPDLNLRFDTVLSFAQLMLHEQAELHPFGATMSLDGETTNVGAAVNGTHHPESLTLIDLMTKEFHQPAATGQIRAAAICCGVGLSPREKPTRQTQCFCGLEHC